jgi:hypothetical protein
MRAISGRFPVDQTVRCGQLDTKGFEEAQIDIKADGHDTVFDV